MGKEDNNFNLSKSDGISTGVLISAGAVQEQEYSVAGKTVAEVRDKLQEPLNLSSNMTALVDGRQVSGDYILKSGESLEFLQKAGRNG